MDLNEIKERLIRAQKNRDALEQQLKHAQGEVKRLSILHAKWIGVSDYFESLLPKTEKSNQTTATLKIVGMAKHTQN